ncbi:MAG: holo-ACP synthase [Buchnera aphidicola (Eriosoma harunire)]
MAILGIGIDIVSLTRIEKTIIKFHTMFFKRILSKNELKNLKNTNNKINYLANRFAAKEATVKALGTGIQKKIQFKNIELYNDQLGKPKINLSGAALQLILKKKIVSIHVSLSHERLFTYAMVIMES